MLTNPYFNSEGKQIPGSLEPTSYFAYVDSIEEVKTGENQGINIKVSCVEINSLRLNTSRQELVNFPNIVLNLNLNRERFQTFYSIQYMPFLDGRWLKLTTRQSRENQIQTSYFGVQLANSGVSFDSITPIRRLTRDERRIYRRLKNLLSLNDLGRDATVGDYDELSDSLQNFSHISVFKVGQGNLNGLCNDGNKPIIYFDMGGGEGRNAFSYPQALRICTSFPPQVILSHWDLDHIQTALMTNHSHTLKWFVPVQDLGLEHFILAYNVSQNGNLILVQNSHYSPNFSILKCTGKTKNDSGLALYIHINGFNALLPGDASFSKIPNLDNQRFDALIATHHGSEYGLTYYRRNMIPTASAGNMLAFSYGQGNTHGHDPNIVIARYQQKGWSNVNHPFKGTPNGSIKMKFCPTNQLTPCLNQCDLETNQCY